MTQRRLPLLIALFLGALLVGGCPQSADRHHIAVLCSTAAFEPIFQGLKFRMEQLGYREDVHVSYAFHSIDPVSKDFPSFEAALGSDRSVDLIFAFPTEAAAAAKAYARQIPNIPVVFAYAGIENADLAASVRAPGDHVTGVRFPGPEQIGKRLEILHTIAPHANRVWVGYLKDYPNSDPALAVLRPLAQAMGIDLIEVPVADLEELAVDLERRAHTNHPDLDAIILMPDTLNHSPDGWRLINGFAHRYDLPVGGSFLYTVAEGAVFGNANDLTQIGKLAAPLVVKIFSGIAAGTIPVVTPEQTLYINYARARELGLHIPEGLLRQAAVILRDTKVAREP